MLRKKKFLLFYLLSPMGLLLFCHSALADQENITIASASAYTATQTKGVSIWSNYDSSVAILGSVRLMAKTDSLHNQENNIQNNDSRLGVAIRHNINMNGNYTIGYYETGMHGLDSASDEKGNDIYTRQAYAGIGNDNYGIITFGKQYAPTDWGLGIDTTYAYGGKAKHDTTGMSTDIVNSSAIYYYNTPHFTFGLMGQGNDSVDKIGFGSGYGDGPDMHDAYFDGSADIHGGAALAATYRWDNGISLSGAAAYNSYSVNSSNSYGTGPFGYVHVTGATSSYDGNTYSMGMNAKYNTQVGDHAWYNGIQITYYKNKIDDLKSARKNIDTTDDQETILGLEYASQFKITPDWGIYVNFDWSEGGDAMDNQHFQSTALGTDYWLGKNAVTYLEYGYEKAYGNADKNDNVDDHLAAVGIRIFI
ncbi:porin [Salmonella enterica]|nr:porin [Salmonella enterica]